MTKVLLNHSLNHLHACRQIAEHIAAKAAKKRDVPIDIPPSFSYIDNSRYVDNSWNWNSRNVTRVAASATEHHYRSGANVTRVNKNKKQEEANKRNNFYLGLMAAVGFVVGLVMATRAVVNNKRNVQHIRKLASLNKRITTEIAAGSTPMPLKRVLSKVQAVTSRVVKIFDRSHQYNKYRFVAAVCLIAAAAFAATYLCYARGAILATAGLFFVASVTVGTINYTAHYDDGKEDLRLAQELLDPVKNPVHGARRQFVINQNLIEQATSAVTRYLDELEAAPGQPARRRAPVNENPAGAIPMDAAGLKEGNHDPSAPPADGGDVTPSGRVFVA